MPFVTTWIDPEITRQISYDTAYMWNLKKLYSQNRNRPRENKENKVMVTNGDCVLFAQFFYGLRFNFRIVIFKRIFKRKEFFDF